MEEKTSKKIVQFPKGIADLSVSFEGTCEDLKWYCVEYLIKSGLLSNVIAEDEKLVDLIPAFGLQTVDDDKNWLPPNHVFAENETQVYYQFRVRHRPPFSNIYIEHRLLSEFFLLQAVDDYLKGPLGEAMAAKVSRNVVIELTLYALFLSSPLPLRNSDVIDKKHKIKAFNLVNYHKHLSESICNVIINATGYLNRMVDGVLYYYGLLKLLDGHRKRNENVLYYKTVFLQLLIRSYPSYCFEGYSAIDANSDENKNVDVDLILYDDSVSKEQKAGSGIYINKTRRCGLDDVDRISLTKRSVEGNWMLDIECSGSKTQDSVIKFTSKEKAVSFITMLQNYMTLCIRPDFNLCKQVLSPSDAIRDSLKSFCRLDHKQAVEYIQSENHQKAENEWCGFLIYQSKKDQHFFHVATIKSAPVCDIKLLDGKRFLLVSSDKSEEFIDHNALRTHLARVFGQQLRAIKVSQSIDRSSMFFIEKSIAKHNEPEETQENLTKTPGYILETDMGPKDELISNSECEEHLKRWIVKIKEEKMVLVELVPRKKCFMEALYYGMVKVAELFRLHPSSILGFYGSVFSPTTRSSYLLEHSPYGDLILFLKRIQKDVSTLDKMKFALKVVRIFCILTQTDSISNLHGNLRGHNFWVFRRHDMYYLKLGDPGLVQYYNTFLLDIPDNDGRIPWLAPERRSNLGNVTVASECYAVATTIAEIFHGTDDFKSVLGLGGEEKLQDVFSQQDFQIPMPNFAKSEDQAVMQSVVEVTTKLWEQLAQCWQTDPKKRPLPQELKNQIQCLEDEAMGIREETIFAHFKAMLSYMHKDDKLDVRQRITNMSTMSEYHEFMKDYKKFYIDPKYVTCTDKELGRGTFGCVYKGTYRKGQDTIQVAIKKCHDKPKQFTEMKFDPEFIKEFQLCASLDHPNLVKAIHCSFSLPMLTPCMLMEFMNWGALNSFVIDNKGRVHERDYIKCLLNLSMDVAKGMEFMELKKVVHCDLAARNVLLHQHDNSDRLIAKVSDFGLAKIINRGQDYYYEKGTVNKSRPIYWYAPEYLVYENNGVDSTGINYTTAGDIWAYGTTLWEMFTKGMRPYQVLEKMGVQNFSIDWLYTFYMVHKHRWPKEEYVDEEIYKLMLKCWCTDEDDRPRFGKIQKMIGEMLSN